MQPTPLNEYNLMQAGGTRAKVTKAASAPW